MQLPPKTMPIASQPPFLHKNIPPSSFRKGPLPIVKVLPENSGPTSAMFWCFPSISLNPFRGSVPVVWFRYHVLKMYLRGGFLWCLVRFEIAACPAAVPRNHWPTAFFTRVHLRCPTESHGYRPVSVLFRSGRGDFVFFIHFIPCCSLLRTGCRAVSLWRVSRSRSVLQH